MGIALPITEILSSRIPNALYQGFYVYLYLVSIAFGVFVFVSHIRSRAVFTIIKSYRKFCHFALFRPSTIIFLADEKTSNDTIKKRVHQFGSFYLRIGAMAFGIGTMVYSGLEMGQYFELKSGDDINGCNNVSDF